MFAADLDAVNRHLDADHALNTAAESEDEGEDVSEVIYGWLKKTQLKVGTMVRTVSRSSSLEELSFSSAAVSSLEGAATQSEKDLNLYIEANMFRNHWQRESGNDYCAAHACKRSLGLLNGKVNCRRCDRHHKIKF